MRTLIPLHRLFVTGRTAQHPICHDGTRIHSWQACQERIAAVADSFRRRPETRWLLSAEAPHHFALLLFALLHAGKQVVIPQNTQPGTLAQLAQNAFDAIADASYLDAPPSPRPLSPLIAEAATLDLYTSGSTGTPKRIRKNLRQFENEIATLESLWGDQLQDASVIATVPHHHIYGLLFRIFWPLSAGRLFDAVTCTYPDILNERLVFFKKATLVSSPAHLSRLPTLLQLNTLTCKPQLVFSSGGPLTATAASELAQAFGHFPIEVFGSTETGGIAWRTQEENEAWTLMPDLSIAHNTDGHPFLRSGHLPTEDPWQMDDAIEMLSDGRFRLGGRLDRIVKIEEKRLSLPDMERHLAASSLIASAAATVIAGRRQTVGAAIVLSDEGKKCLQTQGQKKLVEQLRNDLLLSFEPVLLPKQWRIVEDLPLNERGKLAMQELTALFTRKKMPAASLLPDILAVTYDESNEKAVRLSLRVPGTLTHFDGHFPGLPILPGVVQVDWAVRYAQQYLNVRGAFQSMEQLRFQSIVLPEAHLELALELKPGKNALEFSFSDSERIFSSGRIVFGEAA